MARLVTALADVYKRQLLEGLEDRGIELIPTQLPKETFRTAESILQAARTAEM